jgi:dTDP-4-dehydrorhamnose reductase
MVYRIQMVVGKIKTLILGAGGMLGMELSKVFPDAIKFTRSEIDITDEDHVHLTIEKIRPEVVVNAAAYTNVDGCEDDKDLAFDVNGKALEYIARSCYSAGATLIHYSTDYVFDGSKKEYFESDKTNPINVYGQSKLRGEKNIIENMKDYRIIRTSWLFGLQGKNFVETMLRLSKEVDTVKVVNDQFGKPTYAVDLAQKTSEIIKLTPGIYHITNDGICSWYEFAKAIIGNVASCSTYEFPRKAERPKYSVLVNTKTESMRHWKEALKAYMEERSK